MNRRNYPSNSAIYTPFPNAAPAPSSQPQSVYGLEHQNDDHVSALTSKVSLLKEISLSISDEVQLQNRMMDDMQGSFGKAGDLLSGVFKRVQILVQTGGNGNGRLMCYLVLFVVISFFMLWWLIR